MENLGLAYNDTTITSMIEENDSNRDSMIDKDEFLALLQSKEIAIIDSF